jgi:hypothetical protein
MRVFFFFTESEGVFNFTHFFVLVVTGFALSMDIAPTSLIVNVDQKSAFIENLTTLFTSTETTLTYHGHTNATMDIKLPGSNPFGGLVGGASAAAAAVTSKIVLIPGLSISADIELKGFNNFSGKPATVTPDQNFTVTTIGNTEQVRVVKCQFCNIFDHFCRAL